MAKNFIRKLTRSGKYSYSLVFPAEVIKEFGWRERQKLVVRKYGQGILIKDWKKRQES